MVNFYTDFIKGTDANLSDVVGELNMFSMNETNDFFFLEHFQHIKQKIGVDHIGIGADFDGVST